MIFSTLPPMDSKKGGLKSYTCHSFSYFLSSSCPLRGGRMMWIWCAKRVSAAFVVVSNLCIIQTHIYKLRFHLVSKNCPDLQASLPNFCFLRGVLFGDTLLSLK